MQPIIPITISLNIIYFVAIIITLESSLELSKYRELSQFGINCIIILLSISRTVTTIFTTTLYKLLRQKISR
jgi:hypothetical protein